MPAPMSPSRSASRNFLNGLGIFRSSTIVLDLSPDDKVTTNEPFRGFSSLTTVLKPASRSSASATADFFLNTCQLLQCSIEALLSPDWVLLFAGESIAFLTGDGFAPLLTFLTTLAFASVLPTIFNKFPKRSIFERFYLLFIAKWSKFFCFQTADSSLNVLGGGKVGVCFPRVFLQIQGRAGDYEP